MHDKDNRLIGEEVNNSSGGYKKNNNNTSMKDYWVSKEKKEIFLNMRDEDKDKLIQLDSWSYRALELSILERSVKQVPIRGDIWSLDLGINVGDEMDKTRPCIIVSYDTFNDKSNLCTVVPITHADCSHRTQFEVNEHCLDFAESSITGTAKAEQITTKSKARLGRKIGRLNEHGLQMLNTAILNHLGMESLTDALESLSEEYSQEFLNKFIETLQKNHLLK